MRSQPGPHWELQANRTPENLREVGGWSGGRTWSSEVLNRGLPYSNSHFLKATPMTMEARREAEKPFRLLCYSTWKVRVSNQR